MLVGRQLLQLLGWTSATLVQRNADEREDCLALDDQIASRQVNVHLSGMGYSCTGGVHGRVCPN